MNRVGPHEPCLHPRADGLLAADAPLLLPIMAPRLQGEFDPEGRLKVAIWGSGDIATLRFTPLEGPLIYGPNQIASRRGGIFVAQSQPSLVIRGTHLRTARASRKCAWWHEPGDFQAQIAISGAVRELTVPWGTVLTEQRGDDLVVSAGATRVEAWSALALPVEAIVAEAEAYAARCDQLPDAEPLLRSMVMQGMHAALASIRRDERGGFAGLAAGQAYSAPARTYLPRRLLDGAGAASASRPRSCATRSACLPRKVQPDGEAPSGVIVSGAAAVGGVGRVPPRTAALPRRAPASGRVVERPFRQPALFRAHARRLRPPDRRSDALAAPRSGRSSGDPSSATCGFDGPGTGLPLKPRNDRDWADNVYREGLRRLRLRSLDRRARRDRRNRRAESIRNSPSAPRPSQRRRAARSIRRSGSPTAAGTPTTATATASSKTI